MTQGHPVVERYLTSFEACINEFDFPEREEITDEIRNHIAEARAAGTALDAVLQTLGPADVLARAYAVELALNPQAKRRVRTRGGFPGTITAAAMRPVWALGRFLRAIGAAGTRSVWGLGRFLRVALTAGMRPVWALGRFLRGVVAAAMRRGLALGGFLKGVVARGMRRVWALGGFLKVAVLVLAALIVGTAIGAIGIGSALSGLFMLVVGILEAAGLHVADVQLNGLPPAMAMTVGPMLMVAGGAVLVLLRFYIQFLVTVFPAARGTAVARAFSS